MTNQTPHHPGPGGGFWSRRTPLQRVGLLFAAVLLPCCGGLTLIGALAGEPDRVEQVAPAPDRQLAAADPTTPADPGPATAATAAATPSAGPATASPTEEVAAPVVQKRTVVERTSIAYRTRKVDDSSLDKGETRVRTAGVRGVRTLTYEVTVTDGEQTDRRLVRSEVTRKPVTKVVAVGTRTDSGGDCRSGYRPCVPIASDVDCAGGSGDGPEYVSGPIRVTGSDPYDLDRDGDGIACDD
ncbi:G5 domain-containing protein [Jidongwangia harbinensis]|uniref:G5 domain-containing protein n=1 Tax=Jidongwangia harbinensis TaxID=2878561 RepID=UPI001CD9B62E|nr:G5 domain-containing protein [Jidongwangia harbinensis]MCA2213320.1 G5 domain-containing protein [Jidongwangia harbinensis]